ncbi:immune inhibitor A [Aliiglaciecola sp. CAU 1673]|uniref:immune inhibitor A domain-containing protein n=1 Tax=Aliiglaciecola sp. CAU 1673 TaxID=3032595 RepID=UPI0023DA6907|nr:immune inhibitor A domain-containing protein [Aliiglaciecola sp. CAU 1673]MDF2179704.1 immune inhibitor A [Aliiglaciecola sp. CAU 1673]
MKLRTKLAIGMVAGALTMALQPLSPALAAPPHDKADNKQKFKDDLPHPLEEKRRAKRQEALKQVIAQGKAKGKVHQVAKGQFVELEREGEESIWTVLGEFGQLDSPFGILQGGLPGPMHNKIPEPDRNVDNSTIWVEDFSKAHYEELLFSEAPGAISMRNFYIELSANRYTVNGEITDWVQVPYRAAHYGRDYCGGIVCQTTWWFVRDSVNAWYQAQLNAGMTAAEIDDYLSQFDVWDRYDYDGDGNFDEPDGYIDHFQAVHAGEGQETGGGAQGSDAIWSHRWYVQLTPIGAGGPVLDNGNQVLFGGTRVGNSKYWIGDYTVEPENGAVGVFAHEYAHDLGLPDLYDTSGNVCGSACENSTAFWTLMSSGSYGNDGNPENGIGTKPTHMGAWEKFQLGWLNYEVAQAGQKSEHKLGPATANTKQAQALFVLLPDKEKVVQVGTAYSGQYFWYSGQGNNLDNSMAKDFFLPANASISTWVNFDIETDWDYAYLVISTDGGATWTTLANNLSTNSDPNGQNLGNGLTGNSGGWTQLNADLSAFSGNVLLGFRYVTDGFVVNPGLQVDDIHVSGQALEDAETPMGWAYSGFTRTDGTSTSYHFNAYVAEFRNYRGFDDSLRTGPYNFGFLDNPALGNWVEHFSYQDGLLISYWDTSEEDNSTSAHPGSGLILPVDAHPETMFRADGAPWRSRIQSYDSTFGLDATEALELHYLSQPSWHPSQSAVPVFNDNIQYWNPQTPTSGVINPHTGTQIRVKSISAQGNFMQVQVSPVK